MDTKTNIKNLLEEDYLADGKFFVVDVAVTAGRSSTKVSVLMDTDEGISIDECADISRQLGNQLEELSLFPNAYTLEVSSPGVDILLTIKRQYIKNIGRELKVILTDDKEKKGILKAVNENSIDIEEVVKQKRAKWLKPGEDAPAPDTELLTIAFDKIQKAQVLVSFK